MVLRRCAAGSDFVSDLFTPPSYATPRNVYELIKLFRVLKKQLPKRNTWRYETGIPVATCALPAAAHQQEMNVDGDLICCQFTCPRVVRGNFCQEVWLASGDGIF